VTKRTAIHYAQYRNNILTLYLVVSKIIQQW